MNKNHKSLISFSNSRRLSDFKPLLDSLVPDMGYMYIHSILVWCEVIEEDSDDIFWEVWLIKYKGKVVGMCGLYAQKENYTKELWLGWFGVIPEMRSMGIGEEALRFMENKAKTVGCKKIMSYVDRKGKPLNFYYRNGFRRVSYVKQYLKNHPKMDRDCFENLDDHIIEKTL